MTMQHEKPLSALILGVPNPVSMGIARGIMMAGHRLAAIWYPERLRKTPEMQPGWLCAPCPGSSPGPMPPLRRDGLMSMS
jgi:hypothetical protein